MSFLQEFPRTFSRTASALLVAVVCSSAPASDDWTSWRGPDQNGSTSIGRYPVKWTPDDVAWKVKLPGKGGSTPVVLNERIYLTTPVGEEDAVSAYDFTGRQLWQTSLGPLSPAKHRSLGSSCNASPVTDGLALFVYYRSGHFAALELDGTVRWEQNLTDEFGPERLFWDQGSSPVVTDQYVILSRLHQGDSWIGGFDKQTGELKWKVARNYQAPSENDNGYTTPLLFVHEGKPALLIWGADRLTAHDATNGALLWSAGGFNPDGTGNWPAISNPVIVGELAIVPVGRDDRPGQGRIHAVTLGGSGEVTGTHRAWERNDVGVFVPSLAAFDGRVYLLRHRGGVVCLDAKTGKTVWEDAFPKGSASYYSSPVIANRVLYAAREDGVVFTAKVDGTFQLLGENPMSERIIASPVPVSNRIIIRGDEHLFCIAAE